MSVERKVTWSLESSKQIKSIKTYLLENWSESEAHDFLSRLKKFEQFVAYFPKLYPTSAKYPDLRKALLSKHRSVIYEIDGEVIRVHTILDHRQNN